MKARIWPVLKLHLVVLAAFWLLFQFMNLGMSDHDPDMCCAQLRPCEQRTANCTP